MPRIGSNGRCEECACIPRPDIARARGEEHCRCDEVFNRIYDRMQAFHKQNEKDIEILAAKFAPKKYTSKPLDFAKRPKDSPKDSPKDA